MSAQKIISVMLALLSVVLVFSSCVNHEGGSSVPVTTQPYIPSTPHPSDLEPHSSGEEETTAEEETTKDLFTFSEEDAILLGEMDSDIYGKLIVYYQDDHIAVRNSYDSTLFSFSSQSYSPPEVDEDEELLESDDMNFDGYPDMRLLYRKTSLNTYYLCWMWDMQRKNYVYYEPLANIPSPTFDKESGKVLSLNRATSMSGTLTTYTWQDGDIFPVSNKMVSTEGELVTGPEDADTSISIIDGLPHSFIVLNGNPDSSSRWICKIEDERVVKLYSDSYDNTTCAHKFVFKGIAQGTTTVVLRYATSWNADYIASKELNITVHPDATLTIVEIR